MAEPNTAIADAASAPVAAGQDGLDSAIAHYEASISELQRTESGQAPSPADQPKPAPAAAPTEQPATQVAPEPGGTDEIEDEGLDTTTSSQPTSRMGRLRQQLTQAETAKREAETRLAERDQQHAGALREFIDLVLPDATFESLRQRAEGGDWEAKQQLDQARTWRRLVAPIADVAHHAAKQQFDAALADLRTLDGMDGDSHQKLIQAATPGEKVTLAWELGKKVADGSHKERIAALEAEVQALKTNRAANGSQPASGGTPGQVATGLAGLVGRDGMLTDDALNLTPSEIKARFSRVA